MDSDTHVLDGGSNWERMHMAAVLGVDDLTEQLGRKSHGGISRDQSLTIARAVQDLPGPVFIHCHHGKHRGPTAAVMARA